MAVVAPDPFDTEEPISKSGMKTYRTIAARLAAFNPPIFIQRHIAQTERSGKAKQYSTLIAYDSTLDGIDFIAADPKVLADAFHRGKDKWGNPVLTSLKEDPDHWALRKSFAKTAGTGWREVWRDEPYGSSAAVPREPGKADSVMSMRFGRAGHPIKFTALHCAVHEIGGKCNVHIDESGFMLALPKGVSMTADFYDHIMNELKWKTDFRNWLAGLIDDELGKRIIKEVVRRVSIEFINSSNGYAGLDGNLRRIGSIRTPWDAVTTTARILAPIGLTVDVYENDYFKVQVKGTRVNGDLSVTVTLGGSW